MILSDKQQQILTVLTQANRSKHGHFISWCHLDELLERLKYQPSKQSMQFSLRALIAKKLVVKGELELIEGRKRRNLIPTQLAFQMMENTAFDSRSDEIVEYS